MAMCHYSDGSGNPGISPRALGPRCSLSPKGAGTSGYTLLRPRRHDGEVHAHRLELAARDKALPRQADRLLHVEARIVRAQLRKPAVVDLAVLPHQHGAAASSSR